MVPIGACAIAKKEIARVPFMGQVYLLSGHLLLDRSSKEKSVAAMRGVAAFMKAHGLGAWIWPEGTRSPDGRLKPFKSGFVHLALATGLPVVPIAILDAPARWPARTLDFNPGTLRVEVLEPIDTSQWEKATVADHAETVRLAIAARLPDHQKPIDAT
jgi:1-acyl-sn-glycerol-3-phosphate acyltransferase